MIFPVFTFFPLGRSCLQGTVQSFASFGGKGKARQRRKPRCGEGGEPAVRPLVVVCCGQCAPCAARVRESDARGDPAGANTPAGGSRGRGGLALQWAVSCSYIGRVAPVETSSCWRSTAYRTWFAMVCAAREPPLSARHGGWLRRNGGAHRLLTRSQSWPTMEQSMWPRELQPLGLWSPVRSGCKPAVARAAWAPTLRWTAAPRLGRSGSTRQREQRLELGNGRGWVVVVGAVLL